MRKIPWLFLGSDRRATVTFIHYFGTLLKIKSSAVHVEFSTARQAERATEKSVATISADEKTAPARMQQRFAVEEFPGQAP